MATCSLYIPKTTLDRTTRYAKERGISRNAAWEELVLIAMDGKEAATVSKEDIEKALKIASKPTTPKDV